MLGTNTASPRPLLVLLAVLSTTLLPAHAADLYVCTQGGPFGTGQLYKHLGGSSWEQVSAGVNLGQTILSVETYRGHLVVSSQSASGYGGYAGYGLVWEQSGGQWTRIGVLDAAASVLFALNDSLYAATSAQRIYRYEDQPGKWTLIAEYAGTGFRAGVVANLRGYEEVFLGELDRDTFFRFGEQDGLKFLADYQRSCVYAMTEHQGAVYSGCWHGSWYRSSDGQHVEQMGIIGWDHVWGMASFQGKLWIGSGAGRWGDPGRLRSYDGSRLQLVKEFPTTRYAEGVSSLAASPDGKLLYIGLGMTDGYYAGDGRAEVWTYDGASFTRICEPDFFGGGVQFMRWLEPRTTPCAEVHCLAPQKLVPGGAAVACLEVCGTKLKGLADLELDLPRCTCQGEAPKTSEKKQDALGFASQITSAIDNGDGTTTVTVKVCATGEQRRSMSHLVIGLPPGARDLAARTATSDRGWKVEQVDPDRTTGVSGIKYDETVLGEDGAEECAILTFQAPTGTVDQITVATKAGKQTASVTLDMPGSGTARGEDPQPELLSVSDHRICFTIPVCKCQAPGALQVPVRLTGRSDAPELLLTLQVVTALPSTEQAAYDLLQRAICEARALRRNLDDPLISTTLPKAFALPDAGLPSVLVRRETTAMPVQHERWLEIYQPAGGTAETWEWQDAYPTWYGALVHESGSSSGSSYSYQWDIEYRVGLQFDSELPDNALSVEKVALRIHNGMTWSNVSPFPADLVKLQSSPWGAGAWDAMGGAADLTALLASFTTQEFELRALFSGNGRLQLGLRAGELPAGARSWSTHYVSWGPDRLPRLVLQYVKGYTPDELLRLALAKICHGTDLAGAHQAALAFNTRYGKTAAAWGICDSAGGR